MQRIPEWKILLLLFLKTLHQKMLKMGLETDHKLCLQDQIKGLESNIYDKNRIIIRKKISL